MRRALRYAGIGLALVLYAGTASSESLNVPVPDGITSWTELKLYQTRTIRNVNISCLGRYEKVFKPGSAENMLLMRSGGEWSETNVAKCPREQKKSADEDSSTKCEYMKLKEYRDKGSPTNSKDSSYSITPQTIQRNVSNGWRGYMADDNEENQFPNFGKKASTETGLDKAKLGDIILLPEGASKQGGKPGLAKIAMVAEVNLGDDCKERNDCYVKVFEPDNGKWPDVCGTTDTNGDTKTRYYHMPKSMGKSSTYNDTLPGPVHVEMEKINSTVSCEDTKLAKCVFEPWDKVKLYRIRDDYREGCDKEKVEECDENEQGGGK